MDKNLWNVTVLILEAVLLGGMECDLQLSDKLLDELIVTDTDGYLLPWLLLFFFCKKASLNEVRTAKRQASNEVRTKKKKKKKKKQSRNRTF